MRFIQLLLLWGVASCGFPRPAEFQVDAAAGPAVQILITAGGGQSADAGTELSSPFVVTVEDADNNPVAGVTVDFVVTAGSGALSIASIATNAQGRAETLLTLGTMPGTNTVEARVEGLPTVVFSAIGVVGPAAQILLTSGDGQSGTAGSALAAPIVVTVEDAFGNAVSGVTVTFVVTAGGGSVSTANVVTNAQGQAQTAFTLGTTSGANNVEARATGLSGSPIVFAATGVTGPASQILYTSGNGQTGSVGSTLAAPFVVTVADTNGNPVSGRTVSFVVTAGGGSISTASVATDAQGRAQTTLTLGTAAGANSVRASATGLSGSPFTFTATGLAGPASQIFLTSGNNQGAKSNTTLSDPLVVTVKDTYGNLVPGFTVTFVVTAGGGAVSPASVATDAQGNAQTTWTVGTVGQNTVEARAPGLISSPIIFTAFSFTSIASFRTKVDFTTGDPRSVAMSDLNGDGKPDLAVANYSPSNASVFINTTATGATTPTFAAKVDFTTGSGPYSIATGDLNGDSKPDLAVANGFSRTVSILLNTTATNATTPSFAAKVDFTTEPEAFSVAIGDLNGDGKPDLAVANVNAQSVSVLLNTTATNATTPSFATRVNFTAGTSPYFVAIGDLNGDGKRDLVVANNNSNTLSVLLNTTATNATTPSFAAKVDFATGANPQSVAIGDLNGDVKPDLVVANRSSNTVSVLFNGTATNATTPSFAAKVDFATGTQPYAVAVGDLNGDGKRDLAVANYSSNTVSVLLNATATNATTPSLAAKVDFATGTGPYSVAIGDINGDGKLDLAVANYGSNTISVLLAQ